MTSLPADLAERALAAATGPCVVLVEATSSANLRWAANTLTTNGLTGSHQVTVIAVHDGVHAGVVSRSAVRPDDVAALVADAESAARVAGPSEDAGDLASGHAHDSFGEPPAAVAPSDLASLARGLGAAFESARHGGLEHFGYAEQEARTTYLATSTGIRYRHAQPSAVVQVNGKSTGRTRSAWAGSAAQVLDDVDVAALVTEVTERLGWQARQVELGAGRYDAVLPPSAVADLMAYAYLAADARGAHEGRSVFGHPGGGTRIGEQLTPVPLTLRSDPAMPGLACSPVVLASQSGAFSSVFDNGLPLQATTWLNDGRLVALPATRHAAGLALTPLRPFIDNLSMSSPDGAGSTLDLVGDLDHGLLLTCIWYVREVDPQTLLLTGLTRDGVYLVEAGEVVGAVTNFRFNESPIDLLRRVEAVGATVPTLGRELGDYFPRTEMAALRVAGFNFSSISQAS